MKLTEVKKLLEDNGYAYKQTVLPGRAEFSRQKGSCPSTDTGAFPMLTIPNPHHEKDIQLRFRDAAADPDFYDLEFGGYWYELFDCEEEQLPLELLTEIQRIVSGSTQKRVVSMSYWILSISPNRARSSARYVSM